MFKRLNGFLALALLAASFCAMAGMIGNMSLEAGINGIRANIVIEQGKTRKQQAEYDEYTNQLPIVSAELSEIEPEAKAATELIDGLKAQRKALRKQIENDAKALEALEPIIDNAALEKQVALLEEQVDELQKQLDVLLGIVQ